MRNRHRLVAPMLVMALAIAGCGGTSSTTTVTAPKPTNTAAEAAKEAHERALAAKEEAQTAAINARAHREQVDAERREKRERAEEEAHEHAQQEAAKRTSESASGWSSPEGARMREEYWQHYMAAMPAGESAAHWKAIGECSLKKLESQFTPADFANGDSHIPVTEVQDGVRCGTQG